MKSYTLNGETRKIMGRKVKALRQKGLVPGNLFGSDIKSIAVQFDKKSLLEVIKDAGETSLITVNIEGDKDSHPVLMAGYHTDPVTGAILHVDFHQVNLKEKTTAGVPVHTKGEAPAVAAGNVLVVLKQEIEVEALPTDLPDEIEIDITALKEVGDTVHAKDLKLDRTKVKIELEDEEPIVTIQEPAKEEEPTPVESEGQEGEAEGGKEGAAPEDTDKKEDGGQEKPAEAKE